MKQTEVKTGVLIHIDTLKNCTEMLQTAEQRAGLLETMLAAYYPNEFKASTDHWTLSSWKFLEDNIKRNDAKFEQNGEKKRRNWEEWKERNKREKEAKERELAELRNKLQLLQTTAGTSSTSPSVIEDNPPTVSSTSTSTVSSSTSSTVSSTTSSPSVIDNSITNKNNNSLYVKEIYKTYTKQEVADILEEREIFFKKNFFDEFYVSNESTFHWKYDPYTAALIFIRRHPEAIKKGKETKENSPQDCAAPPEAVVADYNDTLRKNAEAWWAEMLEDLKQSIPADNMPLLAKITPQSANHYGYSLREITLYVPDLDTYNFSRDILEPVIKKHRFSRIEYKMPDDVAAAVKEQLKAAREKHLARKKGHQAA